MLLPLYLLPSDGCYYVSGEVEIEAGAGIAPGVLLQADPDSRIRIAAGACIGVGAILHAHGGCLTVEAGATLGNGVLVVGQGVIGARACIGSASTIFNTSIAPGQVVHPASLLGDPSRQWQDPDPPVDPPAAPAPIAPTPPTAAVISPIAKIIPGQAHLSQLLLKIYPHRNGTQT